MFRLLPRNLDFFRLFEDAAKNSLRSAELLIELASSSDPSRQTELIGAIKEKEHTGDRLTHETLDRLDKTYITPFDRDDIHRLITELDDIVDHINAVAKRLQIYRIHEVTPGFRDQCAQVVAAVRHMAAAIDGLRQLKRGNAGSGRIEEAIIAVHDAENQSDEVHHRSLGELFDRGFEALEVIKWKELYDLTEEAVDRCEDVANTIRGILLKNA